MGTIVDPLVEQSKSADPKIRNSAIATLLKDQKLLKISHSLRKRNNQWCDYDLEQDFLHQAILEGIESYNPQLPTAPPFTAWIAYILGHVYITEYKRRKKEKRDFLRVQSMDQTRTPTGEKGIISLLCDPSPDIPDNIATKDLARQVDDLFRHYASPCEYDAWMATAGGESYDEITARFNREGKKIGGRRWTNKRIDNCISRCKRHFARIRAAHPYLNPDY